MVPPPAGHRVPPNRRRWRHQIPTRLIGGAGGGQVHSLHPQKDAVYPRAVPDRCDFGADPIGLCIILHFPHIQDHIHIRRIGAVRNSLFRNQCPPGHIIRIALLVELKVDTAQTQVVINIEVIQDPPVGELSDIRDLNFRRIHREAGPLRCHQPRNTSTAHTAAAMAAPLSRASLLFPFLRDLLHRRRVVGGTSLFAPAGARPWPPGRLGRSRRLSDVPPPPPGSSPSTRRRGTAAAGPVRCHGPDGPSNPSFNFCRARK